MRILQSITYWIWELVKLNFFWIVYILRGAIIFGLFPSTAALYAVARKWVRGEEQEVRVRLYTKFYRENFKHANMIGWMALFISYIIYLNITIAPNLQSTTVKVLLYGIMIFFIIITGLLWLYCFPTIVTYALPWYHYFLVSIHKGFIHLSYTILQIVLITIYILIIMHLPLLIFFFGISVIAVMQMYIFTYITENMT